MNNVFTRFVIDRSNEHSTWAGVFSMMVIWVGIMYDRPNLIEYIAAASVINGFGNVVSKDPKKE